MGVLHAETKPSWLVADDSDRPSFWPSSWFLTRHMRRLAISRASALARMAVSEAYEAFTPAAVDLPAGVEGTRSHGRDRIVGLVGTRARDASKTASAWYRNPMQMAAVWHGKRAWRASRKAKASGAGRRATGYLRIPQVPGPAQGRSGWHPGIPTVPGAARDVLVLHALTDALRATLAGGTAVRLSAAAAGRARSLAVLASARRVRGAGSLTGVDSPLHARPAGCLGGESSIGTRGWSGRRHDRSDDSTSGRQTGGYIRGRRPPRSSQ